MPMLCAMNVLKGGRTIILMIYIFILCTEVNIEHSFVVGFYSKRGCIYQIIKLNLIFPTTRY